MAGESGPGFTPPTSHFSWDTHRKAGTGVGRDSLLLTRFCGLSPFRLSEGCL